MEINGNSVVNVSELMGYLSANGLVIVPKAENPEMERVQKQQLQRKLLSKKAVTIAEIIESEFFPLKRPSSFNHWINSGRVRPDFIVTKGKKSTRYILGTELKRLVLAYSTVDVAALNLAS